jgi:hypothetical protein
MSRTLSGSLADACVDIGIVVDAHSPEAAQRIGRRRIEAAIIQAGGIVLEPEHEPNARRTVRSSTSNRSPPNSRAPDYARGRRQVITANDGCLASDGVRQ